MSSAIIKCYAIRKAEEEARGYRGYYWYHHEMETPKRKKKKTRRLTFKEAKKLGLIQSKPINERTYWP